MTLGDLWVMLLGLFAGRTTEARSNPAPERKEPQVIFTEAHLERLREKQHKDRERLYRPAPPPPMAFKDEDQERAAVLARDEAFNGISNWGVINGGLDFGAGTGLFWLGYPYLAELSQRPEYRIIVELFADEMTRKWIKLKSTGTADKSEKIKKLEAAMRRYKLREWFRQAKRDDGYFGRGQLYIDIKGASEKPDVLAAPMVIDSRTIPKGSLRGFLKIEPYWVYPQTYNSHNPLRADFFKPTSWTVMGSVVHDSRLLTFIGNPVADLLKPSYSFGGISITQLMKPYVDAFLRVKGSVQDLVSAFSTMVLSTNMAAYLTMNAAKTLDERIEAFNLLRDNFGTFVVDKETEGLDNVSAPLGGLDELQAQAEEHMLIPMRTPLLKAFGLSPSGLNTSNDNEIRSFYDNVNSDQEDQYREPLETALKIVQLSEFGEIDAEIDFDFVPLWQLDEAGIAAVQKEKADTDELYYNLGMPAQTIFDRLAADPESQYHGVKIAPEDRMSDAPEVDDPDADRIGRRGEESATTGANSGV